MTEAAQARIIADLLGDAVLVLSRDFAIEYATRGAIELLGAGLAGRRIFDLATGVDKDLRVYLRRCSGSRGWLPGRAVLRDRSGAGCAFRLHGCALPNLANHADSDRVLLKLAKGKETHFSALSEKINSLTTEVKRRRRIEAVLEENLRERELLLRELNHRVKNNMASLMGIVAMTMRETGSAEARHVLQQTLNKLNAIVAVQHTLYRSADFTLVSADELLKALCEPMQRAYGREGSISCSGDNMHLSNEVAMPVALIINELVTNSVKHAPQGAIRIEMRECQGMIRLSVEDGGPGFDLEQTGSRVSGIGLVRGLVRQLAGKITVSKIETGSRCLVEFPNTKPGLGKLQ